MLFLKLLFKSKERKLAVYSKEISRLRGKLKVVASSGYNATVTAFNAEILSKIAKLRTKHDELELDIIATEKLPADPPPST